MYYPVLAKRSICKRYELLSLVDKKTDIEHNYNNQYQAKSFQPDKPGTI